MRLAVATCLNISWRAVRPAMSRRCGGHGGGGSGDPCRRGVAVLAHPGRYRLSAKWLKRLLTAFCAAGRDALEVAQCQQPPHERHQLALLARQFSCWPRKARTSINLPLSRFGACTFLTRQGDPRLDAWALAPLAPQPGASLLEAL